MRKRPTNVCNQLQLSRARLAAITVAITAQSAKMISTPAVAAGARRECQIEAVAGHQ